MAKPFYITTAIDYTSGAPHIGHALEKVQADVIARYQRLNGKEVFFVTGTDEHGAKIVRAAQAAKTPVATFVNQRAAEYRKMDKVLNVDYDYFIRTTNRKVHWPAVRKIWKALDASGDLYQKEYQGLYCVGHEAFVTKKDLKNNKCSLHGTEPEVIEENNYFFRLSKYTKRIKRAIKKGELRIVPKERENEILKLLDSGLEDISFSRPRKDLHWGIPVPSDRTHTMYVWADALTNYLSALGWGSAHAAKFEKFWPADVQVIGKDILRFHAAIWPALLMSAKLPLPKILFVHGFISVDGQKMSKTLGNVVDPLELVKKYGTDAVRYYLLAEIPPFRDGDFSYEKFEIKYNADLALGLGNYLARIVGLGDRHLKGSAVSKPSPAVRKEIDRRFKAYHRHMESFRFSEAIKEAQKLVSFGDKRISRVKLWELPQENYNKFEAELNDVATILAAVASMLTPVVPAASKEIFKQLGLKVNQRTPWKFKMKKGRALFPRL